MNKVLLNDIKGLICSDEVVVSMIERLSDEVIWKCIWEMEGCVECWNNESYKCCCDWMYDLEERLMEEYLKKGVDIWIEDGVVSEIKRYSEQEDIWGDCEYIKTIPLKDLNSIVNDEDEYIKINIIASIRNMIDDIFFNTEFNDYKKRIEDELICL